MTFGAEGIGLCRTEHMFMEQERLPIVQRMILAKTKEERQAADDQTCDVARATRPGEATPAAQARPDRQPDR